MQALKTHDRPPLVPFTYRARVRRVVDGDTIRVAIDLGFGLTNSGEDGGGVAIRLLGINAREMHELGGKEAKANLEATLPVDTVVMLRTIKVDKFGGRYDAQIELIDGTNLSDLLVIVGYAAAWDGRGVRPVPAWPRMQDPLNGPPPEE